LSILIGNESDYAVGRTMEQLQT